MTSFNDIFKSSFLENVTSISILDILLTLLLAFCLGMFIFFIYKKTYAGVMYSSSFGVTLVALTMVTSMTILAVTSNVVLSLGMVGALSIVRFRTAIKEPTDLVFLFWSIAGGIVLSAGMFPLAIVGSILIGLMLLLLCNHKSHIQPYILALTCNDSTAENEIKKIIADNCSKNCLKSKTVRAGEISLDYEIRLKSDDSAFINALNAIPGVTSASMVSYNGNYLG